MESCGLRPRPCVGWQDNKIAILGRTLYITRLAWWWAHLLGCLQASILIVRGLRHEIAWTCYSFIFFHPFFMSRCTTAMSVRLFAKVDAILARSQPRDGTSTESTPHLPHTQFAIYICPRRLVVAESIATLSPENSRHPHYHTMALQSLLILCDSSFDLRGLLASEKNARDQ